MSYRILSLDGYSVWALIEAKALIELYGENRRGHEVLKDFDLVAGTSGGSIVLGALVENFTLREILDHFKSQEIRDSIFSLGSLADVVLHNVAENVRTVVSEDSNLNLSGVFPKYSAANKLPALRRILRSKGNTRLAEAVADIPCHGSEDIHLLITAFDYDLNRAVFFRSSQVTGPHWGESQPSNVTLAEAIHASTNAPVCYFDSPAEFLNAPGRYWDGAIAGCNNPVLAAVAEAIGNNQEPTDLAVLSIGTGVVEGRRPEAGKPLQAYEEPLLNPGIAADLRKIALAIIDDPPDVASFLAHLMTGGEDRIVRMNPLIGPVHTKHGWALPGEMTPNDFKFLRDLDLDATKREQVEAIERYADLWLKGKARNQPIRMNGKTFRPEVGQEWFSEAKAAWKQIKNSRRSNAVGRG